MKSKLSEQLQSNVQDLEFSTRGQKSVCRVLSTISRDSTITRYTITRVDCTMYIQIWNGELCLQYNTYIHSLQNILIRTRTQAENIHSTSFLSGHLAILKSCHTSSTGSRFKLRQKGDLARLLWCQCTTISRYYMSYAYIQHVSMYRHTVFYVQQYERYLVLTMYSY